MHFSVTGCLIKTSVDARPGSGSKTFLWDFFLLLSKILATKRSDQHQLSESVPQQRKKADQCHKQTDMKCKQ